MAKRIVISIPGGRGYEIPLLYFGAKYFEDQGYEKRLIRHPNGEIDFHRLLENAEQELRSIDLSNYDDIIFIAKSIGTVLACCLKEKYHIPASLILFTPLPETLPYLHRENDILFAAMGDRDRYLDAKLLKNLCEKEKIPCHIEPLVGHRMEVVGDLRASLKIISNVIGKIPRKDA